MFYFDFVEANVADKFEGEGRPLYLDAQATTPVVGYIIM